MRSITVVGEVTRLTTLVRHGSMQGRLRTSCRRITAVVPQLSGRLRERDDEASGPSPHKRGPGGDLQGRGPAVPPFRQTEERKAFGNG